MQPETETPAPKPKWYHKPGALVVAFLMVGPLALPFLWMNPRLSTLKKALWTIAILAASWFMLDFTMQTLHKVLDQYRELGLIQ